MSKIEWVRIGGVSLATAARQAGFDLAIYWSYGPESRRELKKKAINLAISELSYRYASATDCDFNAIDRGVYVICVGWPFAVQYESKYSDVIYIGRGRAASRIRSHFENNLFDLMESLQGVDFTFYFSEPRLQNVDGYYKHIEYVMLRAFRARFGGGRQYPLLNKNAGTRVSVKAERDGWKLPLKQTGKRPRWLIKPTTHNEFGTLD